MICSEQSDHVYAGDRTKYCLILKIDVMLCCIELIIRGSLPWYGVYIGESIIYAIKCCCNIARTTIENCHMPLW